MSDYDTIGTLRDALNRCDPDALVYIDNRHPTALSSYRGYYEDLAIQRDGSEHDATEIDEPGEPFEINLAGYGVYQPGSSEVRIKQPATVGEFVKALDLADGATFEGYKGGQFHMRGTSVIWVSQVGQCDRLQVSSVETLPGRVDLWTTEVGW